MLIKIPIKIQCFLYNSNIIIIRTTDHVNEVRKIHSKYFTLVVTFVIFVVFIDNGIVCLNTLRRCFALTTTLL